MNFNHFKTIFLFLAAWIFVVQAHAQDSHELLSTDEKNEVIDAISQLLEDKYVFPELGKKMADQLKKNLKKGRYKNIEDPAEFQSALTDDLLKVSQDKHLRVMFDPKTIDEQKRAVTPEDEKKLYDQMVKQNSLGNFGFNEVKILEGNIGYLDLRSFQGTSYAGETAVAAMNFLSHADAIIIDLRKNGGGSPQMIQLITSYLFDEEPVHLNNFFYRPLESQSQTWTLPHVPGKRNPDAAVYVLTSKRTFSAAEEFSYNLKNLERATLIGETTGGGAHPGGSLIATDRFQVWVPTGRAINPITKTNWEGTGVEPHIEVEQKHAFDKAYKVALVDLIENNDDEGAQFKYSWIQEKLKVQNHPVTLSTADLTAYLGSYGPRKVTLIDGQLFYQRNEGSKYPLIPMGEHRFMIEDIPTFRIEFEHKNEEVVALIGLYDNGNKDKNIKN